MAKLKPAYEQVAAGELQIGDIISTEQPSGDMLDGYFEDLTISDITPTRMFDDHLNIEYREEGYLPDFQHKEQAVFRKLPDRGNPAVLRLALEMACAVATNTALLDPNVKVLADGLIDRALEEIENKSVE